MNLVADESVDFGIIKILRDKGCVVKYIVETNSGIKDDLVLEITCNERFLLLTEDKDFGELIYRLKLSHSGILLIRLSGLDSVSRINLAADMVLTNFEALQFHFSVLNKNGLRIKTGNKSNF